VRRRLHHAGMGTHDYWLYSFGLVFVTVLVIVA
jgi:hypothetical protein